MNDKIIIYQVLCRLFGNESVSCKQNGTIEKNGVGKFNNFTEEALKSIKKLGTTHIWYTGIIRHATQTNYSGYGIESNSKCIVKGRAGSPYAITDYYDVNPDLAVDVRNRMKEFEDLVERTHKMGLKVIIDFVPNHVSRQYSSSIEGVNSLGSTDNSQLNFSVDNNFYYINDHSLDLTACVSDNESIDYYEYPAKVTGNDCFSSSPNKNDWYETIKLNYGVDYVGGGEKHFYVIPDTWHKMLDILLFWSSKGVDGFRCDMAEMVPVEFWSWAIPKVKEKHNNVLFVAEVYNPCMYSSYILEGKFDYLYDKVGLYDTLRDVVCERKSATEITRCWQSLCGLETNMLNFLENHDEQRIASDFFASDAQKAIPAFAVSALMNVNPVMIYFGQEFGERGMDIEGFSGRDGRTTIFDYWSIDTIRRWTNSGRYNNDILTKKEKSIYNQYKKIMNIARKEKAISKGFFFDLMYVNADNKCFNNHRQYAFIRKYERDVVLIVANFSSEGSIVGVNIPSHAFDYLQICPNDKVVAKDLMTGKEKEISFVPYSPTSVEVKGNSVSALKFTLPYKTM